MKEVDINKHITAHYDEKYSASDASIVKKITYDGHPVHRSEAALSLAGSGERVLEIGSGCGEVILTLTDHYKECVGIELSPIRAKESQKLFADNKNVRIINGNFETMAIDFPKEHFDTIILIAVIEHLIDPFAVMKKIHDLLKPNGRVIIDTPNLAKWTRRIKLLFGYFPATASIDEGFTQYDRKTPTTLYDEGHFHYFTFRSLKKLLLKQNFKSVNFHGYGWHPLTRLWPKLFSECLVVGIK